MKALIDDKGLITKEGIQAIQDVAKNTSCECPGHLIEILETVQRFTAYQVNCLKNSPQDEYIHQWLHSTSKNLEHLVSNTIVMLARMEGLLDENNKFKGNDEKNS